MGVETEENILDLYLEKEGFKIKDLEVPSNYIFVFKLKENTFITDTLAKTIQCEMGKIFKGDKFIILEGLNKIEMIKGELWE